MQRLAFTVIVVCLLVVVGPARVVYAQSTACPSTVPYGDNPAAGRFVTVNGVRLYYELYGRGPTLVLLHGNGGSIVRMACLITKFSSTHAIIAIDSRGRGKSEDGETPFTFEQQADDVAALLEHERIESAHVLGSSDGAIIALVFAIRHPMKVRKVVASAPNLWPDDTALFPSAIARMKAAVAEANAKIASGDTTQNWVRRKRQVEQDLYEPHISIQQIRSIQAPTLLVGADDDMIRPEHYLEIYRNLSRAHFLIVPGVTHGGPTGIMSSDLFYAAAARFLKEEFVRPASR